ncbi:hypothetical protein RBSH_05411 [Rhodopirellula baltica SH28]|uniref:Uncharacterized protein n=1 Tax=Rhodopirellula baltica SH28 TaxID=993517 RepID=K5E0K2_RHOBT|nr:hypothetical protein [Rhodopirellula baltica]EKJ99235.1 hypothetical protein RBSH_05411 [Rhodopirellula baltica SH28]
MRKQKSSFGIFKILLASLLVVLVLGGGVIASLWASGVPMERLAFWRVEETRPDSISLPMNWQTIPAYSKVTRNDLIDPRTGGIQGIEIPLTSLGGMSATIMDGDGVMIDKRVELAQRTNDKIVLQLEDGSVITSRQLVKLGGAYTQATDIIGRVVKSDKSSGFAFAEANFFERGTPAGLAGATPPGMRAMTLEAAQLAGVHRISMGEQIDLVANIPLQKLSRFEFSTGSHLPGAELVADAGRASRDQDKETTARLVARQAVVLTPVIKRVSTETSASLSQGKRLLSVPVEEVVLAVAAEDVSAVTSALELGATVNVLVRSGRPDTEESSTSVPEGMVAVPIPGQTLLAYQTIRPTSFEDPATAYVRTIQVPKETANQSNWITDLSELVGRIPRHDLPATVPIQEGDLMPVGAMVGLSGATPPERVLFFLDTEGLIGGDAFEFGQHLDLVASRTADEPRGGSRGGFANVKLTDAQRTRVEPIADDVIVVMPTRSPGNPTARKSKDSNDSPSPKLIVAVRPDQVAHLEYAVAVGANLRATVRSGRVESTEVVSERQPAGRVTAMRFDPLADTKQTDIFVGGSSQSQLFRGRE